MGDVDFSSVPGFSGVMEDRSQNDWPMAQVAGQGKKGSMVEIPIVSGRAGKFSGWQMNLHYDARQMEVVDIIWATSEQLSNRVNRGWNIVSPGNIRLIWWDALTDFQAQSGTPICWLKVRLLQDISTEKPLFETSDEGMQSILFDPNGTNYAISMGLTERSSVLPSNPNGVAAIAPLSVYPNPTSGHFRITMHSDKAQQAALTITDLSGKIMVQQDIELTAGDNSITSARLPQTLPAGQYEVQLKTNSNVQRVRLVKQH